MKNIFEFFKIKQNRNFSLVVVFVFIFGLYLGFAQSKNFENITSFVTRESQVDPNTIDLAPFWKVWGALDEKYPGANATDNQARVYGAIKGLVGSLEDPYTSFFTPEEAKLFEEDIAGNFSGVGMEVGMKDKVLTVIAPLKNTPAYNAGIKAGDKILQIDEKITNDLSIDEAIKLIRGEKGTTVALSIYREGENKPREIKIVRDTINVPTIDTELRDDKIFVVKLYSFGATSINLFREAMQEFSDSKTDKLLIDLRGNPGGYLEAAVDMASWFLPNGKTVLIEDYGEGQKQKIYRSHGYDIFNDNLKYVILIDGGSASASEILAGAMQDHSKAKIVGTQSYGKGSVQEVIDITNDTLLKVTVAKWLTPNGLSISNKGLTPDYVVEQRNDPEGEKTDAQLEKAVELLLNWTKIEPKTESTTVVE
ncbi:MAG: S41 family peptidase [Candidatus Paceibacterota bacterium]